MMPPAPGQVSDPRARDRICGTDVEIFDGTMPYFTAGMARYPVVPGHEWVGEVLACGDGVEGFAPGERVVGECSVGCMRCAVCLAGNYHRCPNRTETGILNRPGAFAERIEFPGALPAQDHRRRFRFRRQPWSNRQPSPSTASALPP